MSILERFEFIKERVKGIAEEAFSEGFITEKEKEDVFQTLEKERITIGVVGQVKYGKSTLINALIFGNNILPAAATPMTASLSVLKYGNEAVEVEFYTKEDWEIIEEKAKENSEKVEVVSAKELIEKAQRIKSQLPSLLGKKKKISFKEIYDYVGGDGRYTPVTKALTIWYPSERLKEVDIVDTPGFNDPIISREYRAEEFLSEADVVLVLFYSDRPFDITDKEIIFKKIRKVGTGKVVIILNKYDITFKNLGTVEKVERYIREKFEEEVAKLEEEDKIIARVFKDVEPIRCSSLAALLGRMKREDIEKDENLKEYFNKFMNDFPFLKTQDKFIEFSNIKKVEEQIDNIIKKDKLRILSTKAQTSILEKIKERLIEILGKIDALEAERKGLERKTSENVQELKSLKTIEKTITDKIESEILNYRSSFIEEKRDMEEKLLGAKKRALLREIMMELPEKKWYERAQTYLMTCKYIVENHLLEFRGEVEKEYYDFQRKQYQKIRDIIDDIDMEIENMIAKHLEYSSDIVREMKNRFLGILNERIEIAMRTTIEFSMPPFWRWKTSKAEAASEIREGIDDIITKETIIGPIEEYIQRMMDQLAYLRENFNDRVIRPIRNAIENAIREKENKEKRLKEISKEEENLKKKRDYIENKIKRYQEEIESLMEGR